MSNNNNNKNFTKSMSKIDVLFLSLGAMLGWGWVVLSGEWVASAGFLGAVIAFILGGLLVIFIGLTYAELSSAMPETGGGLVFVKRAFGKKSAFVTAWGVLFGYVSVVTFEAVALPTVIDYVMPVEHKVSLWTLGGWEVFLTWALIGTVGSIALTALNFFGIKPAAVFQNIFTVAIVLVAGLIVYGAIAHGDLKNLDPMFTDGIGGTLSVLVMIPFLFVGFDVIPQVAAEINAPGKSIGRIIIVSIISAVCFYLFVVFGVAVALPDDQLLKSQLATADAMVALFGSPIWGYILVIGGIAGIITSWNAFIIGGSRILYAMAENNMIPKWFSYMHPKYQTPTNAIIFLGILAAIAPFLGRPALVWLVDAGGVGIVVGYLLVSIAFIKLRKTESELHRPYRIKYWKFTGIMAIVLSILFISFYLPGMPSALVWPMEWVILGVWCLIGFGLYSLNSMKVSENIFEKSENYTSE
ncbi:APC family permease [Rummeliibacillus sp. NPDC094406]|uniref:APC family permease n=1 Tax=Rummeliibacillus sp. NPDC094406 TaxID=3364511 RepID=UPI0037FD0A98